MRESMAIIFALSSSAQIVIELLSKAPNQQDAVYEDLNQVVYSIFVFSSGVSGEELRYGT
jgi:hypothetical protein